MLPRETVDRRRLRRHVTQECRREVYQKDWLKWVRNERPVTPYGTRGRRALLAPFV